MYCPNCGELVADNANFCRHCGYATAEAAATALPATEPQVATKPTIPSQAFFLVRLAKGEFGLRKTFWEFNIAPNLVVNFLNAALLASEQYVGLIFVSLVHLIYTPFVISGVWQAAKHYNGRLIWRSLAQISIVFSIVVLISSAAGLALSLATKLKPPSAQMVIDAPASAEKSESPITGFTIDVDNLDYELPAHTLLCLPETANYQEGGITTELQPTVFLAIDSDNDRYSRCDRKPCDTYDATFEVIGESVTIKPLPPKNGTIIIAPDGSYVEQNVLADSLYVNRGRCYVGSNQI